MNNNELILFKEMIKETFRNVLKEELPKLVKEELDSIKKNSSKDMKEVKLLIAHQIKESKKIGISGKEHITEETRTRLGEVFNRANKVPKSPLAHAVANNIPKETPTAMKNILLETAEQMSGSDLQELGTGEDNFENESFDNDYGEIEEEINIPGMPEFPVRR
jgi:hypothetical protein